MTPEEEIAEAINAYHDANKDILDMVDSNRQRTIDLYEYLMDLTDRKEQNNEDASIEIFAMYGIITAAKQLIIATEPNRKITHLN